MHEASFRCRLEIYWAVFVVAVSAAAAAAAAVPFCGVRRQSECSAILYRRNSKINLRFTTQTGTYFDACIHGYGSKL